LWLIEAWGVVIVRHAATLIGQVQWRVVSLYWKVEVKKGPQSSSAVFCSVKV